MGESIKRDLTPTVGQNQLQAWLRSPRRSNPLKTQSTELRITQELLPFQDLYRYVQREITLVGAQTIAIVQQQVPLDEAWLVDGIWVTHDGTGDIVFQVTVDSPLWPLGFAIVTRQRVESGSIRSTPLIGSRPLDSPAAVGTYHRDEPLTMLPGDQLNIANTGALAADDVVRFNIRYKHRPIPIEVQESQLLWTINAII